MALVGWDTIGRRYRGKCYAQRLVRMVSLWAFEIFTWGNLRRNLEKSWLLIEVKPEAAVRVSVRDMKIMSENAAAKGGN